MPPYQENHVSSRWSRHLGASAPRRARRRCASRRTCRRASEELALGVAQVDGGDALVGEHAVVVEGARLDPPVEQVLQLGRQVARHDRRVADGAGLLRRVEGADQVEPAPLLRREHRRSRPAGPSTKRHGSDPMNVGVSTIWSSSTAQFTLRWCPSSCHPQGSPAPG